VPVKVLVVDDDEAFRYLLRVVLELAPGGGLGPVIEAEDGAAALDVIRSERPPVVVMDVMMPRLDGLQATRLIKQEWPRTRVVVVTSVADEDYRRAAMASGADAFLNKADLATSLAPTIRALLAGDDEAAENVSGS